LFVITLLFLSIFILNFKNIRDYFYEDSVEKKRIVKSAVIQLIILIPAIVLTLIYLSSSTILDGNLYFLSTEEICLMIKQVQPAKGIEYGKENIFTKWIFYSLLLISLYIVVRMFVKIKKPFQINPWFGEY